MLYNLTIYYILGFGLFGAGLKFGFEPEEDEDEK